jgi:radical SAM superfamily enzyme
MPHLWGTLLRTLTFARYLTFAAINRGYHMKPHKPKATGGMLQHRHLELLASIIQGLPGETKQVTAEHFARHLYRTNPGFKLETFIGACLQKEPL